ncbi:hypothetical protein JCM8202_004533 [Rhodotorula sphaerocarpa]
MHGVRRQRRAPPSEPEDALQARRDAEKRKIDEYVQLCEKLYAKRAAGDCSAEALDLTTKILTLNPEFQSAWAFRRRILQDQLGRDQDADARQKRLEADLQLTNIALRRNPKNYSVWEHRKWVLDTMPQADWSQELALVEAYLQKDGRNFHTWDYRRYVMANFLVASPAEGSELSKGQPTLRTELAFTGRKISENFSNFSAWHYRTKLLGKLWAEQGLDVRDAARQASLNSEFELVRQALWSDPNDQSAWLYHRWLIGQVPLEGVRREIKGCEELLEEEPDCRWVLDSIVTYKRILSKQLEQQAGGPADEADALKMECVDMLQRLQEVDPMRRARYVDLSLEIVPARR